MDSLVFHWKYEDGEKERDQYSSPKIMGFDADNLSFESTNPRWAALGKLLKLSDP